MTIVSEIQAYFESKHSNCEISLMQFTKSQRKGDTMHFYVFIDSKIEYLVTTYKKDSVKRMQAENDEMTKLFGEVTNTSFLESVLFSFEQVTIENISFRIQKYVDFQKFRKKNQNIPTEVANEYIKKSFGWIQSFQSISPHQPHDLADLKLEIMEMAKSLPQNHEATVLFHKLIDASAHEDWHLKKGYSHGDFCYYNYIITNSCQFKVFDWEHATNSYWTFYDPILNLNTIWIHLFYNKKVGSIYEVLCLKEIDSKAEELLLNYSDEIRKYYDLSQKQLIILIVFSFYRNMMREGKYVSLPNNPLFMDLEDLMTYIL
jgi:hypothetical protein